MAARGYHFQGRIGKFRGSLEVLYVYGARRTEGVLKRVGFSMRRLPFIDSQ
jgi:hypothetical protein